MPTLARLRWLTAFCLALWLTAGGGAARILAQIAEAGPAGGFQAGDKVPYFYVRAITGPLSGKSVCYVCRNGDRPVVMVLARRIIPVLPELLKQVDAAVDGHRADGLRGFGVFVDKDPRMLLPQVQTLSFNGKLALPLTIAAAPAEGLGWRGLPDEVAISVVLYRDQQVLRAFHFRDDDLATSLPPLLDAVERLAEGSLKR